MHRPPDHLAHRRDPLKKHVIGDDLEQEGQLGFYGWKLNLGVCDRAISGQPAQEGKVVRQRQMPQTGEKSLGDPTLHRRLAFVSRVRLKAKLALDVVPVCARIQPILVRRPEITQ
jgi:hypothetical protein